MSTAPLFQAKFKTTEGWFHMLGKCQMIGNFTNDHYNCGNVGQVGKKKCLRVSCLAANNPRQSGMSTILSFCWSENSGMGRKW